MDEKYLRDIARDVNGLRNGGDQQRELLREVRMIRWSVQALAAVVILDLWLVPLVLVPLLDR